METTIYKNKENVFKISKEKQKLEANLRLKGLTIEKMRMNQTDVT